LSTFIFSAGIEILGQFESAYGGFARGWMSKGCGPEMMFCINMQSPTVRAMAPG
jgi:hypothetical protein